MAAKAAYNAEYFKRYYAANKSKKLAYQRKYNKDNKQKRLEYNLKKQYGVSLDRFNEMVSAQGGTCAICHMPPKTERLYVDHNHLTGEVRQLLCNRCNAAIGLLDEVPDRLRAAAEYLERHDHEYSTY